MTRHHPDAPAAFVRAVCERPDDDGPRMQFADWLDDNEPDGTYAARVKAWKKDKRRGPQPTPSARAELIRTQVELERCPCKSVGEPAISTCGCRGHVLRRRERELLLFPSWAAWVPKIPELTFCPRMGPVPAHFPNPVQVEFRRGFVEEVTLPWNREHIAAILDRCPIRKRNVGTPEKPVWKDGTGGKVVLTTWPEMEGPIGYDVRYRLRGCEETIPEGDFAVGSRGYPELMIPQLLAAELPGVEFELPATFEMDIVMRQQMERITPLMPEFPPLARDMV